MKDSLITALVYVGGTLLIGVAWGWFGVNVLGLSPGATLAVSGIVCVFMIVRAVRDDQQRDKEIADARKELQEAREALARKR